jgi:hypothetical protein
MSTPLSLNDIKYDLLKIIEPWDGCLAEGSPRPVRQLFTAYLLDNQKDKTIYDFSIDTSARDKAITFDINIRMSPTRAPKKLKIHVGIFTKPWCNAA